MSWDSDGAQGGTMLSVVCKRALMDWVIMR